jgi:hypothetical protein
VPCRSCGRKFNPVSLQKHAKICQKVFQEKRKEFNVAEQRKTDDQTTMDREQRFMGKKKATKNQSRERASNDMPIQPSKKELWKKQSEELRNAMKAGRGGGKSDSGG